MRVEEEDKHIKYLYIRGFTGIQQGDAENIKYNKKNIPFAATKLQ